MILQKFLQEFIKNHETMTEFNLEVTEEDEIFTICINFSIFITLSEYRDENGHLMIRIIVPLNKGIKDDALLELFKKYNRKLSCTPLYGRTHLIVSEDNKIGLLYEHSSGCLNENSFQMLLQMFIKGVLFIVNDECSRIEDAKNFINNTFKDENANNYEKLLINSGINLTKLIENCGILTVNDDFNVNLYFHTLSGMCVINNRLEVLNKILAKDFLLLNASFPIGVFCEYEDGYVKLSRTLDPRYANANDLKNALKKQRFLVHTVKEYIDNYKMQEAVDSDAFGFNQNMV